MADQEDRQAPSNVHGQPPEHALKQHVEGVERRAGLGAGSVWSVIQMILAAATSPQAGQLLQQIEQLINQFRHGGGTNPQATAAVPGQPVPGHDPGRRGGS